MLDQRPEPGENAQDIGRDRFPFQILRGVFQQEMARRARPQIAERQLVLDRSPLIAVAFHGKEDNGGKVPEGWTSKYRHRP